MATNYQEPGQLPEGVALAHTLHGQPDDSVTHAHTASPHGRGVQPAPDSGIRYYEDDPPHVGSHRAVDRLKRCMAKDDTCMGWQISNSEFCAAHAGVFKPKSRLGPEQS
jgi:hypothetical protein